jgi:hypothetical protein
MYENITIIPIVQFLKILNNQTKPRNIFKMINLDIKIKISPNYNSLVENNVIDKRENSQYPLKLLKVATVTIISILNFTNFLIRKD